MRGAAFIVVASGLSACTADKPPADAVSCSPVCRLNQICVEGRCTVLDGSFVALIQPRDGAQEIVPIDGAAPGRPTTVRLPEDCDVETEVRLRARTSSTGGSRNELTADLHFFRRSFPAQRYVGRTTALPDAAFPVTGPGSDRRVARIRLSRAEVYDVRVTPRATTPPALFEGLSVASCPGAGQTFELFPARRIQGVVLDALDGRPQANIDVWALGPADLVSPVVRTDEAGRFTLDLPRRQGVLTRPELPGARFVLRARRAEELEEGGPPSWRFRRSVDFAEGQELIEDYEIRLEPTLAELRVPAQFELRGRTVGGQERPVVPGAEIRFELVNSSTRTAVFSGSGVTDDRGQVQIVLPNGTLAGSKRPIPVLAGRIQFSVRPPSGSAFGDDALQAQLSPASPSPLQLELTRPRTEVLGRVVDRRQAPLRRAFVLLVNDEGRRFFTFTDANGGFSLGVEPGRYGWSIEGPRSEGFAYRVLNATEEQVNLGTMSLPPTAEVELDLESSDGAPVIGADVTIYVQTDDGDPVIEVARGRSDAEGRLRVRLPLQAAEASPQSEGSPTEPQKDP